LIYPVVGPCCLGPGPEFATFDASSESGDVVGINLDRFMEVTDGYVSGSPISGTATWDNTTIAGLDLTERIYTWVWGSGSDADFLTINVGDVPEPAAFYLGVLGLVGLRIVRTVGVARACFVAIRFNR
jgi:hypothetical protein